MYFLGTVNEGRMSLQHGIELIGAMPGRRAQGPVAAQDLTLIGADQGHHVGRRPVVGERGRDRDQQDDQGGG